MPAELQAQEIRRNLDEICRSELFRKSEHLILLLRFVVNETLQGEAGNFKEAAIESALNWRADKVRQDAVRLRGRLDKYYLGPGAGSDIRISIPKGAYRAEFTPMQAGAEDLGAPARSRAVPRSALFIACLIAVFGVGFIFGRLTAPAKSPAADPGLTAVLRCCTPAWIDPQQSNGTVSLRVREFDAQAPNEIDWYGFGVGSAGVPSGCQVPAGVGLPSAALEPVPIGRGKMSDFRPTRQLHFHSSLTEDFEAWTGPFFWNRPYRDESTEWVPWSLPANHDLIFILSAQNDDVLEIGLKDAERLECKLAIRVRRGWAGYRLPLADFRAKNHQIDPTRLVLLVLAHSRKRGSGLENTFEIALISSAPRLENAP